MPRNDIGVVHLMNGLVRLLAPSQGNLIFRSDEYEVLTAKIRAIEHRNSDSKLRSITVMEVVGLPALTRTQANRLARVIKEYLAEIYLPKINLGIQVPVEAFDLEECHLPR